MKKFLPPLILMIFVISGFKSKQEITVFFAADSTVKKYNQSEWPQRGWAQPLETYFNENVTFENLARGGRSTKSFIAEGLWDSLLLAVDKGDVVLIQFGHNDHDKRKPERYTPLNEYKLNLTRMVRDVKRKSATPVLVTPIAMRSFKEEKYYDGHGDYPKVMKEVASENKVQLIDLNTSSGEFVANLGYEKTEKLYMNLETGDEKNWPEGKKDNTHLSYKGAKEMALLVIEEIKENKIKPLYKLLK